VPARRDAAAQDGHDFGGRIGHCSFVSFFELGGRAQGRKMLDNVRVLKHDGRLSDLPGRKETIVEYFFWNM